MRSWQKVSYKIQNDKMFYIPETVPLGQKVAQINIVFCVRKAKMADKRPI